MFGSLAPQPMQQPMMQLQSPMAQLGPLLQMINRQNQQRQGGVTGGQSRPNFPAAFDVLSGKTPPVGNDLLSMLTRLARPGAAAPAAPMSIAPPGIVPPAPIPAAGPAGAGFTGGPAGLW